MMSNLQRLTGGQMGSITANYKVPLSFILICFLFVSSVVVITPLMSSTPVARSGVNYYVIHDGLIFMKGETHPYSGRIVDTLDKKIIEYDVVDGLKHGKFTISTLGGNYSVSGFVAQNKNVGNWKYFYDTGSLESTGDFQEDKPHGKWIWYYHNGKVKSEGQYINGKPEGKWISFDLNGVVNKIIYYYNGEIINEINLNIHLLT